MGIDSGLCVKGDDGKTHRQKVPEALTFHDPNGNPKVWVFPSEGRIWKDRWVAFTNSDEFRYFKGSQSQCLAWAYCEAGESV